LACGGARGLYRWDGDYVITFRASNCFPCIAFGDGGFVATVVAVKADKRIHLIHLQVSFLGLAIFSYSRVVL
jgi:hypothetical protein